MSVSVSQCEPERGTKMRLELKTENCSEICRKKKLAPVTAHKKNND